MKPESITVLEQHKQHWQTLRDAGYIKQLEYPVKKQLEKVYQHELDPNYHENLWCGDCVAKMVRTLYTNYERFLATQKPQELNKVEVEDKPKRGRPRKD